MTAEDDCAIEWHEGTMPYSTRFGDHYYTNADGLAESRHVFLAGNGLPARFSAASRFRIGELGFGTGLNVLAAWTAFKQTADAASRLEIVSFERWPLDGEAIERALSAWPELAQPAAKLVAEWPADPGRRERIAIALDERTDLIIHVADAAAGLRRIGEAIDAWFLDGFAPARNPQMWDLDLMRAVFAATRDGGSFATYTAAGWVRRNLAEAGFSVERLKGFGAKREMLAGRKL